MEKIEPVKRRLVVDDSVLKYISVAEQYGLRTVEGDPSFQLINQGQAAILSGALEAEELGQFAATVNTLVSERESFRVKPELATWRHRRKHRYGIDLYHTRSSLEQQKTLLGTAALLLDDDKRFSDYTIRIHIATSTEPIKAQRKERLLTHLGSVVPKMVELEPIDM